jgi:hypothetical protein
MLLKIVLAHAQVDQPRSKLKCSFSALFVNIFAPDSTTHCILVMYHLLCIFPIRCPPGYLCYFDTPCDINDLPTQPSAELNTISELEEGTSTENSTGFDTNLELGEGDSAITVQTPTKTSKPTYPPQPTQAPWAEDDPRLSMFCGEDWGDASNTCQIWCPDGGDDICPYGE